MINLGYAKPTDAVRKKVDEDDRMKHPIMDNLGRKQESWIINESGLYSLILSSKLPNAKKFKRCKEGVYILAIVLKQSRTSVIYAKIK